MTTDRAPPPGRSSSRSGTAHLGTVPARHRAGVDVSGRGGTTPSRSSHLRRVPPRNRSHIHAGQFVLCPTSWTFSPVRKISYNISPRISTVSAAEFAVSAVRRNGAPRLPTPSKRQSWKRSPNGFELRHEFRGCGSLERRYAAGFRPGGRSACAWSMPTPPGRRRTQCFSMTSRGQDPHAPSCRPSPDFVTASCSDCHILCGLSSSPSGRCVGTNVTAFLERSPCSRTGFGRRPLRERPLVTDDSAGQCTT